MDYEYSMAVNFTTLKKMILVDETQVHVHNPKKIERKHVGIVCLNLRQKNIKLSLRSASLWISFIPIHKGKHN